MPRLPAGHWCVLGPPCRPEWAGGCCRLAASLRLSAQSGRLRPRIGLDKLPPLMLLSGQTPQPSSYLGIDSGLVSRISIYAPRVAVVGRFYFTRQRAGRKEERNCIQTPPYAPRRRGQRPNLGRYEQPLQKVAPDGSHDAGPVVSSPERAGCQIEVRRGGFRARKSGSLPEVPGMGRICGAGPWTVRRAKSRRLTGLPLTRGRPELRAQNPQIDNGSSDII